MSYAPLVQWMAARIGKSESRVHKPIRFVTVIWTIMNRKVDDRPSVLHRPLPVRIRLGPYGNSSFHPDHQLEKGKVQKSIFTWFDILSHNLNWNLKNLSLKWILLENSYTVLVEFSFAFLVWSSVECHLHYDILLCILVFVAIESVQVM